MDGRAKEEGGGNEGRAESGERERTQEGCEGWDREGGRAGEGVLT